MEFGADRAGRCARDREEMERSVAGLDDGDVERIMETLLHWIWKKRKRLYNRSAKEARKI